MTKDTRVSDCINKIVTTKSLRGTKTIFIFVNRVSLNILSFFGKHPAPFRMSVKWSTFDRGLKDQRHHLSNHKQQQQGKNGKNYLSMQNKTPKVANEEQSLVGHRALVLVSRCNPIEKNVESTCVVFSPHWLALQN